MALIWARVHGNTLNALINTELGVVNYTGETTLSGISQQGNFIEIDTQSCHDI